MKARFSFGSRSFKPIKNEESVEIKLEKAFQQVTNRFYERSDNEKFFHIKEIEKDIIETLLDHFNQGQVAKLTGLSVRTIRNKINGN